MKHHLGAVAAAVFSFIFAIACTKEIHVKSVTISPETLEMEVGDQRKVEVVVSPENASNKKLVYSSSNEAVAKVSQNGNVVAFSAGTAIITVKSVDGGRSASCNVSVIDKVISVTGISLNKTNLLLMEGEEYTLVPKINPDDAANKSVNWSSDDETIVSVSAEGVVKALKVGKATVTATTVDQGKTASCTVDVQEGMEAVTGAATHISCRNAEISGKVKFPAKESASIKFGVMYSTSSDVTESSSTMVEATSWDSEKNFTVKTEVLEPETTYYYRSYNTLANEYFYGNVYGEIKSFKTLAVSSMLRTLDATDVNTKDAVLNASLDLTDCSYETLEYGFEITPDGASTYSVKAGNLSGNKFSYKDESLSPGKKYSYAAFATLDGRSYKAEPREFSTASLAVSVTAGATNVKHNAATISGALTLGSGGDFTKSATLYYSGTASTLEALKSDGKKVTISLNADGTYSVVASGLLDVKKYYFVVVAMVDDVEFTSGVGSFTTKEYPKPIKVDLGLSVKWASFNLGASAPEEYGGYFQWAGTEDVGSTDITLDWSNCPYYTVSDGGGAWSKYNLEPSHGEVDNKKILEPEDDAATVKLGADWRMPTYAELKELMNNCTKVWTSDYEGTGIAGRIFTSNIAGYTDVSIFLPAAGFRDGSEFMGGFGAYWSSSLGGYNTYSAGRLYFDSSETKVRSDINRYYGQSVRPVSE